MRCAIGESYLPAGASNPDRDRRSLVASTSWNEARDPDPAAARALR
jgi:hypothetical protein